MQVLFTKEGRSLSSVSECAYPRPQMVRSKWMSLNGEWSFVDNVVHKKESILVPFCPESVLSGIHRTYPKGAVLEYSRTFEIPAEWEGCNVLIHFGAVDNHASVEINGEEVCCHSGGYLPFSADITSNLREGKNEVRVHVSDDLSHDYPWGKQCVKRGGMWYTPVSGIWQSVWLEPVPDSYIEKLTILTNGNHVKLAVKGVSSGELVFGNGTCALENGKVEFDVQNPEFWSPENPHLYDFTVRSGRDCVHSYFALRDLSVECFDGIKRLCLNGKPYFFNGLLDQGYWSDGLYTPASSSLYEKDILAMKELGYNTLRKHIKIEPEQFYYDCDRLGMIVFQDMVNNGDYSFMRDTALPTVGIKRIPDNNLHSKSLSQEIFISSMIKTERLLFNHPCICLWTIFNEAWGQFCADNAYAILKKEDPSRFIDATSGWFHQKLSDVDSNHIYFGRIKLGREDKPQLLSEFGGYSYKIPEHSTNLKSTYGYRLYKDRSSFVSAFRTLYEKNIVPLVEKGLCGAIYTQLSDVEDETNGLFTYDREVLKIHSCDTRDIFDRLKI